MASLQAGPADAFADRPPKVVLDTNAVLDALLFGNAAMRPWWAAVMERRLLWLATPAMRDEFARQLHRPALARYGPDSERLLCAFDQQVLMRPEAPALPAGLSRLRCRDGADQSFVDLAVACKARFLVSRDRDLLSLARHARPLGLAIVTPETAAEIPTCSHTGNARRA